MNMMSCPEVTCTHPANRPGNCCPSCTMCEINNVQYRNGQSFTNPADSCEQCTCRVSHYYRGLCMKYEYLACSKD